MSRPGFFSRVLHALGYTIPTFLRPLFAHLLHLSPTSSVWDFRTAMVISIVRSIFNDPAPVSMLKAQISSITEPTVKGPMWISKDELRVPGENNLRDVVVAAVKELGTATEERLGAVVRPVKGEWVGHAKNGEPEPDLSEEVKYQHLVYDTRSRVTFIFLHGGQFYMRNPASRRAIVHSLAKLTSGRCFSVAYRLSPQNVFPSALLDLLVVYLSLLHPPPGSRHAAVPATDICISGDSSGANIALALLQLILHLQQRSLDGQARVRWNGCSTVLPCPAALATHSGYFDLTRSLPSETANLPFDVIPSPYAPPSPQSSFLPDSIWPASSPRHHVYAPTALLTHPLVSPITSPSWRGCPTRVWLSVGQECLADGSIVLAKRMALQGVAVVLEMYAGMPHDFLVMFMSTKTGQACLESWAAFARESVEGAVGWREKNMNAQADIVRMNGTREAVDLERLEPRYTLEEIVEGMEAQIARWGPP